VFEQKLPIAAACVFSLLSAAAIAVEVSKASIEHAGRNIMRTADGGLVATYVKQGSAPELVFGASVDNGKSWREAHVETSGPIIQSAIDSNFQGSYIAFTEQRDGKAVGRIAFTAAPFAEHPTVITSDAVTPAGVVPTDTYIQASRKGWGDKSDQDRETVVYGWQDAATKALYVGVSPDGRTFPEAKKVLDDEFAKSGPAVAIRGKYIFATYLTTNPAIVPSDVPASERQGRAYQAILQSVDGGQTWTQPQPLFGHVAAGYPSVNVQVRGKDGKVRGEMVRLDHGTGMENHASLDWASEGDTDGIDFAQSSLSGKDSNGNLITEVGIVSFKRSRLNDPWKHVVANNLLVAHAKQLEGSRSSPVAATAQFQYSALPDTPIRLTTYTEYDTTTQQPRLVLASSSDTGMTFNHHASFTPAQLAKAGLGQFTKDSVVEVSQCLFEDRDGTVYVDFLAQEQGQMRYARVPIGINAVALRKSDQHAAEMRQRADRIRAARAASQQAKVEDSAAVIASR